MSALYVEQAPAKLNLTLKVGAADAKGYHPLFSLVAFTTASDELTYKRDAPFGLSLSGPFQSALDHSDSNLVLKAAHAFFTATDQSPQGHFSLHKTLPVASGIGGGSADAAAALRLLSQAFHLSKADKSDLLPSLAKTLGADVTMCLTSQSRFISGYGEKLGDAIALPACFVLLAHPGFPLSTPDVFAAFDRLNHPVADVEIKERVPAFANFRELVAYLAEEGNDLYPAALTLAPTIAPLLESLRALPDVGYAAMSGSGATCFALFDRKEKADKAATYLAEISKPCWLAQGSLMATQSKT